jgi:two-component system, NarL family, sensor histidine kinase UhpB
MHVGWVRGVVFGVLAVVLAGLVAAVSAQTDARSGVKAVKLQQAVAVVSDAATFPAGAAALPVELPDEWDRTRTRNPGPVWYRLVFDRPAGADERVVLGAFIPRACSNLQVWINEHLVHDAGSMREPITRHCHYSDVVPLPAALLRATGNHLDIKVAGYPLHLVAARQRSAGLSPVMIGALAYVTAVHERHRLVNVSLVQASGLSLVLLGGMALAVAWWRRLPYAAFFGAAAIGWGLLSARIWWRSPPWSNASVEIATAIAVVPVAVSAALFLLRYCGVRQLWVEGALWLQCLLMPVSLWLLGADRLFAVASTWYVLLCLELIVAASVFLWRSWWHSRLDFWTLGGVMALLVGMLVIEVAMQQGMRPLGDVYLVQVLVPVLFTATGVRIAQAFARAMRSAETAREDAEQRVRDVSHDLERNYAQLAEMRVEQMTAKERKRIAGDLHDDLGAKLLTIVHTSDNERIATLAREALDEMRLSVRGITGKPVNLGDAIGDWRSESMSRLSDAGVELTWHSDEMLSFTDRTLGARIYVQTTRILREAISNMLKHAQASQCEISVNVTGTDLELTIADNGRGIPVELDGKLDRGHGMASMKHRAKNLQGQCLIESGPGYGTVIRLTLPLA